MNGRWLWRSLRLTSSGSLSERVNETEALVGLVDDQIVNAKKSFSAEVNGTSLAVAEGVDSAPELDSRPARLAGTSSITAVACSVLVLLV